MADAPFHYAILDDFFWIMKLQVNPFIMYKKRASSETLDITGFSALVPIIT